MSIRTEPLTEEQSAAVARVKVHRAAIEAAILAWVEAVEAAACLNDFASGAADDANNTASDCMEAIDQVAETLCAWLQFRD
jgi:hypothetical protein